MFMSDCVVVWLLQEIESYPISTFHEPAMRKIYPLNKIFELYICLSIFLSRF
jgi:hypothetical protein